MQISFHAGIRPLFPLSGSMNIRGVFVDRDSLGTPYGFHPQVVSFETKATKFLYSPVPNKFEDIEFSFLNEMDNASKNVGRGSLSYLESSSISLPEDGILNVTDKFTQSTSILSEYAISDNVFTVDAITDVASQNSASVSDSLNVSNDAVANLKINIEEVLSRVTNFVDASLDKGDHIVTNIFDSVFSLLTFTSKSISERIDNALSNVLSTVDRTGEVANKGLTDFSADLNEVTRNIDTASIDALRWAIVTVEDYLASGTSFVVYYYGNAKDYLPPEARDALNLNEDSTTKILRPVGSAIKQVYSAIEVLETYLGVDPNDPIVPFLLFVGTTVTLGISYRVLTYGGYSGDLSPKSALDLLAGKENGDVRERDGVPDLRLGSRYKYASVTLPKIDASVKNLIKNEKALDDALVANVIRNLKVVQDRSKVIVLDADGTRSKVIARSLRKLGIQASMFKTHYDFMEPYLVQGGFRSWVKNGLRVKELRPETTLTVLNEDAEEILGDVKSNPLQIVSFGVAFFAAAYALLEWEKSLQLIGVIGLVSSTFCQTIYWRVSSYEDSEDFKKDVRLLLVPIGFGAQAFTWAATKLEPNKIGLQTTPSSSAIQDRVLQAAAKHESQPLDAEETQDPSGEPSVPVSENEDLSDA
ncbi:hypothetical protein GIB67_002743 [Kingdonia uniflora]|uniref:Rhodanese domain-containing protein n=1 Tax=Kingdonia uniflora TaxID=39325 RepID=A0A7J7N4K5_9MAGN|nr:hypothetical protein GIB67_002743 [Kingdonia uniflora]